MKRILTSVLLTASLLWVACTKENGVKTPVINVSANEISVAATAESGSIGVTVENGVSDAKLTAQSEQEWVRDFKISDNKLTFKVDVNISDERKAFIILSYPEAKDAVVTVKQMAAGESISLSKVNAEISYKGSTTSTLVTSDRKWALEGTYDWVHPGSTEGLPNTEVSFTVDPNLNTAPRNAEYFVVSGKNKVKFTISQKGAPYNDTFTDKNFKNYIIKNFDTDKNGELSQEEVDAIEVIKYEEPSAISEGGAISPENNGIASFKGIEGLKNLKEFSFITSTTTGGSKSTVETIDLSKNKKLESFNVRCLSVKSVNLEGLTALKSIKTGTCANIAEIKLGNNPELTEIYAFSNNLTSLDLSSCTKLKILTIYGNKLKTLDLSALKNIEQVDAGMGTLESITLPANSKITSLGLNNSKVKELNFANLPELVKFSYQYCQIRNVAFVNSPNLEKIDLYMHQSVHKIDVSKNLKLKDMEIRSRHDEYGDCLRYLEEIILSEGQEIHNLNPSLQEIKDGKWKNADYVKVKITYIEDPNFNVLDKITDAKLKEEARKYDTDGNGILTKQEAAKVTDMNLKGKGIGTLEGLQWFTGLLKLDASNNMITDVDMSKWKSLTDINLSNNKITSIDFTVCTALVNIDFSHNELTKVSNASGYDFKAIQTVNFSYNKLTKVRISGVSSVKYIDLSHNEMKSAEIENNSMLTYLDISNNKFAVLNYEQPFYLWSLKNLKTLKADNYGNSGWLGQGLKNLKLETLVFTGDADEKFVMLNLTGSATTLKHLELTGCTNLKDVYIGEGAVISDADIIKEAGTTIHRTAVPE